MYNTERTSRVKRGVLTALMVACLIAIIGGTYARYLSTGQGTATVQVAKWAIEINDTDITPDGNTTFDITFTEVANDNIRNDRIAPSGELYADFEIDPTGSEVAIDYSFTLGTITASSGTAPSNIIVTKVVPVTSGSEGSPLTADGSGNYTGTIPLASQTAAMSSSDAKTIRVYIAWTNDDTTNVADTAVGVDAPTLSMTVTGTASQHID